MSDRIDELVAEAEFLNDNGCDKCEIVTQLATIARNTECMKEQVRFHAEAYREARAETEKWHGIANELQFKLPNFTEMGNCWACGRYAPFDINSHDKTCPIRIVLERDSLGERAQDDF